VILRRKKNPWINVVMIFVSSIDVMYAANTTSQPAGAKTGKYDKPERD
jgi:hypothetical protein